MAKDVYDIGEIPPVGEVPGRMHAQLVRPDRYGDPEDAIRDEVIDVPEIGPDDALVLVMAAGVNFNNVWAARGVPVDVTKTQARWGEPTDFHIVGSDAAGVVYAIGERVTNVRVGDRVVVHAGQWDLDDPWVIRGNDPGLAPTFRVWGYDTCWGSFAQFTKVQAHQCLPKAERLTWEEAAAPTLTGGTAYRMLHGWPPNTVKEGDVVLVWGASGGPWCRRPTRARSPSRRGRPGTWTEPRSTTGGRRPRGTRPSGRRGSKARRRSARRSGTWSANAGARTSCSSTRGGTRSRPRSSYASAGGWS
jgi:Alcohol dehydrogenase GroES-like domain